MDHEVILLLERMLLDGSIEPTYLPFSLLKAITNNFSEAQKIGSGGFATVYKGLLENGIVAVKRLVKIELDEKKFNQEIDSLMRVKHKNIVRFLGYCADTQGKIEKYEGKNVIAEDRQRLLCFEFLLKGSLDKYICDASGGLEWRTRYQIIRGICEGLQYLHHQNIVHLDLKPGNILLDQYMNPKIADFGLSRCFDEKQTRAITLNPFGTQGYMAPEFFGGVITFKSDIYSLGIIIIEMLTGKKGYPEIENVLESWSTRFQTSQGATWLEHVRVCAEIGLQCMDSDLMKRPNTQYITETLDKLERTYGFVEPTDPSATHLSEDKTIMVGSKATSNVGSPSMDNPRSVPFTPQSQGTIDLTLYMHQTIGGPNYNQVNIANIDHPEMFGCTIVHDYPVYDSLGPRANIVARAQGLHTQTNMKDDDCWFHWSNIVFSDERLGSSIMAIGNQNKIQGEWVIVGGTGEFTFAQGTITICRKVNSGSSNIKEICIRAFGCTGQTSPIETKHYKDNMINVDSSATSNACSPSMVKPQSGTLTPQSLGTEYNCILYMHQIISGPKYNQVNIADPKQPHMFGYTNVHDYPIYDSLGPGKKIVARSQGLHTKTGMNCDGWFHWSKIAFDYERFQGSSFNAMGNQEGEWAIVGGTGDFTFAQGTITTRRLRESGSWNIKEIRVRAFRCTPTSPTDTKPFRDKIINVNSNATTNVCGPSMALIPQSSPVTPQPRRTEYNDILYMHQIISGPDYNQVNIADPKQPHLFGYTNVHDYPLYDSLGPEKKLVARAQGLHTKTSMDHSGWFHWSSVVFSNERFHGSSLKAIGNHQHHEGEWAIVGGTGAFAFAQGTISTYKIQDNGFSNIKEIRIHALCYDKDHAN